MDYEKKYKDALERARNIRFGDPNSATANVVCEEIFPELKMSEDERIRKEIIEFLQLPHRQFVGNKKQEGWIAWLEKQGEQKLQIEKLPFEMKTIGESLGFTTHEECDKYNQMVTDIIMSADDNGEQKPADKIEPWFKVGDWVVRKDGSEFFNEKLFIQVVDIDNEGHIWFTDGTWLEEKDIRFWTIEDAKDGDVLASKNGCPFIYKKSNGPEARFYCCVDFENYFCVDDGRSCCGSKDSSKPATKEQRDFLFSKMKEAGYEWNAEKKELKKIEHNSAWSEEDEGELYLTISLLDKLKEEAYTIDCENCINWLKSLKPQPHWKPTEEQIYALSMAYKDSLVGGENLPTQTETLKSLYNDLKKL